jgi:flagellar basal-body rod protein FlgF/flagellar basal-body rod protein FlgG
MIRGLYGAATALDAAFQSQDVYAQNIAHANVPGYRRTGISFEPFNVAFDQAKGGVPFGARPASTYTDFRPGPLAYSGNKFDLALDGEGFFVVRGPNGPVYTRNGAFEIDTNGQIRTHGGLPVLGADDNPITIPQTGADVSISSEGNVFSGGTTVGQIRVVSFADQNRLVRVGSTSFSAPEGTEVRTSTANVRQGYRESANLEVATEMVSMIRGARYFEAAQRVLRTLSESIQLNTRPQ